MTRNKQLSFVWNKINDITIALEQFVWEEDERRIRVYLKKPDQLRLLTLYKWSLKYYLPISEIIKILIPVVRTVCKRQRFLPRALGVRITSLTGRAGERIIQEEIERRYPANEHIQYWKEAQRRKQIEAEDSEGEEGVLVRSSPVRSPLQYKHPMMFVEAYRERLQKDIRESERIISSKRRRRKAYRWNPWV